jgi:uncharacterized protein YjaZ
VEIIVHNTLPVLYPYFTERHKPRELLSYLIWAEGENGLFSVMDKMRGQHAFQDFDILSAVRSDGIDLLEAQQQYGLFNPSRNVEATKWCFDESAGLQIDKRIEKGLSAIAEALPPSLLPERLAVYILPPDCANGDFILNGSGLTCYGRIPGYMLVRIWPTAGNMNRLGPVLARSLIHGVRRRAVMLKSPIPLGEAFVMEGLAAAFVYRMFPDLEHPPFIGFRPPNDWEEVLSRIAGYYGESRYDDITVNVYGSGVKAGSMRPPLAVPLTDEELDYAAEEIRLQADRSEPNLVAAYLYGDPLVAAGSSDLRHSLPGRI